MLSTILVACQSIDQQEDSKIPQFSSHEPELIKHDQKEYTGISDHQLQVEGGSEREIREPEPVSNSKLQKEYPNIIVLHGSPSKNQVALTFDDGPDTRFTPQVLDVLAKYDVKATFFLIGSRAKAHSEITRRIHEEGHAIGNHTYWHPNLPKEELERLHWEL